MYKKVDGKNWRFGDANHFTAFMEESEKSTTSLYPTWLGVQISEWQSRYVHDSL